MGLGEKSEMELWNEWGEKSYKKYRGVMNNNNKNQQ